MELGGRLEQEEKRRELLQERSHRLVVRAPAAGEIAALDEIRIGDHLDEGETIGTLLAPGELRIVASFGSDALGRLQPGQSARLRFDAFPWTEFGSLSATLQQVAADAPRGSVRVFAEVDDPTSTRVPLQHGLEGELIVRFEETAPLSLLLRTLGRSFDDAENGGNLSPQAAPTR